jgi:hypothetical protein
MGLLQRRRARRLEQKLAEYLEPGEKVRASARDMILRDEWAITDQRLLQLRRRDKHVASIALSNLNGDVRQERMFVSVRLHSTHDPLVSMLAAFRKPNELTRRIQSLLDAPGGSDSRT